jgi:hypothetical protein
MTNALVDKTAPVRLALCGLARDCAPQIAKLEGFISALQATGIVVECFVGENGSRDRTREMLGELQTRGIVRLLDTSFMAAIPHRLERLARGREHVKSELCKNGPYDFACVMDLDNVLDSGVDIAEFVCAMNRLKRDDELFGVAAFSVPCYYDLLGLECRDVSYGAIDRGLAMISKKSLRYYPFFRDVVYPLQKSLTINPPDKCISAFNGMCIYKYEQFAYSSYIPDGYPFVCDHVMLNRKINAKYGTFVRIEPMLALAMPREHGPQNIFHFYISRIYRALKGSIRKFVG